MQNKKIYLLILFASVFIAGFLVYKVDAITNVLVSNRIEQRKIGMSYTDVIAGTNVLPDGSLKRVVLYTLPASNQILSIVTSVGVAFLPSGVPTARVYVENFIVEQNGSQVSTGDVTFPAELTYPHIENRPGNSLEQIFFSESSPVEVVMYIRADGGYDLNTLIQGSADFYVVLTKP